MGAFTPSTGWDNATQRVPTVYSTALLPLNKHTRPCSKHSLKRSCSLDRFNLFGSPKPACIMRLRGRLKLRHKLTLLLCNELLDVCH